MGQRVKGSTDIQRINGWRKTGGRGERVRGRRGRPVRTRGGFVLILGVRLLMRSVVKSERASYGKTE
jgi:hypothetical protein